MNGNLKNIFVFPEFFFIFILKYFFFNYFQFYFKIVEFEKNFSNTFNSFCFCFFLKRIFTDTGDVENVEKKYNNKKEKKRKKQQQK